MSKMSVLMYVLFCFLPFLFPSLFFAMLACVQGFVGHSRLRWPRCRQPQHTGPLFPVAVGLPSPELTGGVQ